MIKPYKLGAGKLLRKTVSGIVLSLLVISTLTLAFNIQPVKAEGTIYIRADGSVDPPTAPISSADNITYNFIEDIVTNGSIIIQRDDIVVDGAGYTLQGTESEEGIYLSDRSNVTIRNIEIKTFGCGILLYNSSNNSIYGNKIANNTFGIQLLSFSKSNNVSGNNIIDNAMGAWLGSSSNNTISVNNVTNNNYWGIVLGFSSCNNIVFGNNIMANQDQGVHLMGSSNNNSVFGNNITDSNFGIFLYLSSDNKFYHNNFVGNTEQVHFQEPSYANFWDDGYPSGGNYWSDYAGKDENNDGIGDAPYVINAENVDRYPLMNPHGAPPPQTYSLTITTTAGGTTEPAPGTYSYIANSTVQVTAIPDVNCLFDYWELDSVNVGSANPYSVIMDNDHTLHTVFVYVGTHNVAVTNVTPSKTVLEQGHSMSINVTVTNQGDYIENFNLTLYANTTIIDTFTSITLTNGSSTIITFTWSTADVALGRYTISAEVSVVPGETDTADNFYVDGIVQIVPPIHDIAITNITFSKQYPAINETIQIYVTIENRGTLAETFDVSVNYTLLLDPLIGTQPITLAPGETITLNFTWTPNATGRYEIKAYTSEIPDDINPSDNTKITYLYVSATYTAAFSTEENDWANMDVRGGRFYFRASPV